MTDNYTRLDLQFILSQQGYRKHEVHYTNKHDQYGLGIDYLVGINITGHKLPLFVEIGPDINYTFRYEEVDYWDHSEKYYEEEIKNRKLSIGTPVNISYKIRLCDAISIAPYLGLNVKYNILAASYYDDRKIDAFDDENANRFQLGWNIGFGFYFKNFYVGNKFYKDITPFIENRGAKVSFRNYYLNLGVKF